jgi:molybdopterin-containing oxidoreductase family membrane subunit
LASAFVTGPAFIVICLEVIQRTTHFRVPSSSRKTLVAIVRVTSVLNLFMLAAEVFTEFYTGGSHVAAAQYLFFGLHGHYELVPWIWSAITLNVFAVVVLYTPALVEKRGWLLVAMAATMVGIWIEKGMGLIVPGFIPSTLHEIVPYSPSVAEWKVTVGVWAFGLMALTVGLRIATRALTGEMHDEADGGDREASLEDQEDH